MLKFLERRFIFALAGLLLCVAAPASAEITLKAITALPSNLSTTHSFLNNFVAPVNSAGKGNLHIEYMGGPEVIPPRKAGAALARGVIDMLHGPAAYYQGTVPEAAVLSASNRPVEDVRAAGGIALLNKIWNKKLNAEVLGWGESGTHMNFYLTQKPVIGKSGPDLEGLKIRSTSTYRPLITALGGTPVSMKASEIFTGLQRGVVEGFGWPNADVTGLGVARLVKYRLDPGFYRINDLVLVNLDKWHALPKKDRDLLDRLAIAYEQKAVAFMAGAAAKDLSVLEKNGMAIVTLHKPTAKAFLRTAYGLLWKEIEKTAPANAKRLRAAFYKED